MTITTPVSDLLVHARRCEAEQRWSQAAASYQEALDNMAHPTSGHVADDRALIEGLRDAAVRRSHEMVSLTATSATEEARKLVDQQGERAAAKRAQAIGNNTGQGDLS